MRYFTSDLHFRHPFVAALRGYAHKHVDDDEFHKAMEAHDSKALAGLVDWERHDKDVLDNIRKTVGEDDDLFILGDLSSGGKASTDSAIEDLKSLKMPRKRMHLVLGNHDSLSMSSAAMARYLEVFGEVSRTGVVSIAGTNVIMSHFQFKEDFNGVFYDGMSENTGSERFAQFAVSDDGKTLLLHGHTHAKTPFEFGNPREMNVGLDAWGMRPVSEDDIIRMFGLKANPVHEKFPDVLDSFLHGAYRDKTATLKVRKGEYDKACSEIIEDETMGHDEKLRSLDNLNDEYSKTVQSFDENGEDDWCKRSYDNVMDSARKRFGKDPEFSQSAVDMDSMALTADVKGSKGSGTIRVRMVSPTRRMSAHVVVTTKAD